MKSIRSRILMLVAVAGVALVAFFGPERTTDLGSGLSSEAAYWVGFSKSRRSLRHVWLTSPDGTRTQLSESPVYKKAIIQSNSVVVWNESRFKERLPFHDVYSNAIVAADSAGHRVDLTPWLKTRAANVLPVAPVSTLPAIGDSSPVTKDPPVNDPRIGVQNFTPAFVRLAYWRPGITFWCDVPLASGFRPLAMQVPVEEIAAYLRQQPLASNR
jgi:hypothetical protein